MILHAHTLPEVGHRHTHDTKLQHNTATPVLPPVLQAGEYRGNDTGVATTDTPHSPAADQVIYIYIYVYIYIMSVSVSVSVSMSV